VVVVLFITGDQAPVIPFIDVVGKEGTTAPLQKGPTELKVGIMAEVTVIDPAATALPQAPSTGIE
jgi:hypothetical protein